MIKKRTLLIIGIVLILVAAGFAGLYFSKKNAAYRNVCFDGRCFKAEVVATKEERRKGLQFRKFLGEDEGMLFFFPTSRRQSFWMKDTFIPLDIIWIDSRKRIAFIMPDVLPCQEEHCPVYTPDRDAKYVLEVNAGVSTEMGLRVGDQAVF